MEYYNGFNAFYLSKNLFVCKLLNIVITNLFTQKFMLNILLFIIIAHIYFTQYNIMNTIKYFS